MKPSIFSFAIMIIASGAFYMSCSSSKNEVEISEFNAQEKLGDFEYAIKNYATQYNKFEEESDDDIIINKQLIAESKLYSNDKINGERIIYEKRISVLEAKNEKLKEKLNDYIEYNEEDYEKQESFKREFNNDMNELNESLRDIGKNNVK